MEYENALVMGLQAEIKWIHQELDNVKDTDLVEAIKNIIQYRKKVNAERISIKQYNKEIEASIAQVKEGKTYTHQEVGQRIKKWAKQ